MGIGGVRALNELNGHPAAKEYQQKIFAKDIPATMFGVEDIQQEFERLHSQGVNFTIEPTEMGSVKIAIFDDTCGNLIQIAQML